MTKARNISDLLDANGDVKSTALDNVPPSNDASALTTGTLPDARLSSAIVNQSAFKNIIINGDMNIAQRGTSVSGITGSGYYTVDRFQTIIGSQGTWTQSQSTDVPSGQGFTKSLKMDCTTADASPSASDSLRIRQNIEGQFLQYLKKGTANAESITASFWTKSNKTGTYIFEIFDTDNARYLSKTYTISSSNTWEKKTITFEPDTSGTIDNNNGGSFECTWWLGAGTNFTSGTLQTSWSSQNNANRAVGQVNLADSTANEWYITGVQLEAGEASASDFEFLPYDVSFERCERYFQYYHEIRLHAGLARIADTGGIWTHSFYYRKPLRATPTKTYYDTDGASGNQNRNRMMRLDSSNTTTTNLNHGFYENTNTDFAMNSYNTNTGLANYGDIGILTMYDFTADAELG